MSEQQHRGSKSALEPKAQTKGNQPTLTELTPEELEKINGGICATGKHIPKTSIP